MSDSYVRTLERAIAILQCFNREKPELSLTEIAEGTGLSVATTLRLIRALEKHGFLLRQKNKYYSLGLSIYILGNFAKNNFRPQQIISTYMLQIRDKTNESVALYGLGGEGRICYEHFDSLFVLSSQARVGKSYPLWAGAGGRVLLAYMREENIANELQKIYAITESTITDKNKLRQSLYEIRERGYAISKAEQDEGVLSIAIPIFDNNGSIKYSLTVTGPMVRFTLKDAKALIPYLKDICQKISILI